MSQIRTRHHDDAARRRPAVAGSRGRARRTLDAGTAARAEAPNVREPDVREPAAREPAFRRLEADESAVREPEVPEPAAPGGAGRPFRGGWPMITAAVLVAALVALAVTAGLLAARSRHQAATDRARDDALAAARTEAQAFLSYDYRHLDADVAAAKAGLTGRFAGEYAATSTAVVRPTALQYKAVVKAQVVSLGVVDAAPDQVVVLAYVDQTTTSTRLAGPRVDANRVRMTLVPIQGRWKVSAVDAL